MMFNTIEHEHQKELEGTLNNADTSEIASSKSNLDTLDCQNAFMWKLKKIHFSWLAVTAITLLIVVFFGAIPYKFLVCKVRW